MASFTVDEIIKATGAELLQKGTAGYVTAVSTDTRTIRTGELFIALTGDNFNGHDFLTFIGCASVYRL